jgi:hypothetical protein
MSSHILSLLKFRKSKKAVLTNEEKVKALSEKAVGLFDHMKKAHTELGDINAELRVVAEAETEKIIHAEEEHNRKKKQLQNNREKALNEIDMNEKIQGKLVDFIR